MGIAAVVAWATVFVAVAGAGLALVAWWRWRSASRNAMAQLTACKSRARGIFSHQDLAGLPPPVAHYLGRVLHESQPLIRAARIEQDGVFFLPAGKGRWVPMYAVERFLVNPAAFCWDARLRLLPAPVFVRDSYMHGRGEMEASIAGLHSVVHDAARPRLNAGALQRYLAESIWFPTALLPGAGVTWTSVDAHTAIASITDGRESVWLRFHFDEAGDVAQVEGDRYREDHGRYELRPWIVTCRDFESHNGVRIPVDCQVSWQLPGGLQPYWKGHVRRVTYEFAEA